MGAKENKSGTFEKVGPCRYRYIPTSVYHARINRKIKKVRRSLGTDDRATVFCEIDKYARVAYPQFTGIDGRRRINQRFKASAGPLSRWHPPKWGINDKPGVLPNGAVG